LSASRQHAALFHGRDLALHVAGGVGMKLNTLAPASAQDAMYFSGSTTLRCTSIGLSVSLRARHHVRAR